MHKDKDGENENGWEKMREEKAKHNMKGYEGRRYIQLKRT